MTILEKIRSRGHWRVCIRPVEFDEKHVENISNLLPIVTAASVQLRGWDFPHIDQRNPPELGSDWVQQHIDWHRHIEFWRIYQSGQFIYYGAYRIDWSKDATGWDQQPLFPPPEGLLMSVEDIVCCIAEFFEFAVALSLSEAGSPKLELSVTALHLDGRELRSSSPEQLWIWDGPRATLPKFELKEVFDRQDLVSNTRSLGLQWAKELFRRFSWDPSDDLLEAIRVRFR